MTAPTSSMPHPTTARVVVADDHIVWRQGLRSILEPTFEVVGEAGEGHEAVDQALAARPDVVIMDISMPGMDGIAACRRIREQLPDTGVVIISATDEDSHVYQAIEAGVSAYVVKDGHPAEMIEAVRCAADGEAYLPPLIAKRILHGVAARMNDPDAARKGGTPLSSRELSVLRLLAEGRRHKEIARELCISIRTVGNHVASIYNKLGIDDRSQAIVHAIKLGLVRI